MMQNLKRGFTLIELLVVIAIIGILAAIVLASLGTARTKGSAAAAKEQLNSARNAAEVYYASANNYGTAGSSNGTAGSNCGTTVAAANSTLYSDTASNMAAIVSGLVTSLTATKMDCGASSTGWSIAAQLPDNSYWCVDSNGVSRGATSGGTTYTGLNGASPAMHSAAGAVACQ